MYVMLHADAIWTKIYCALRHTGYTLDKWQPNAESKLFSIQVNKSIIVKIKYLDALP